MSVARDRCDAYGITDQHPQRPQCLQHERQAAEQANLDSAAALLAGGTAIQNASQPNPPLNCTSTTTGVFTNTNCY